MTGTSGSYVPAAVPECPYTPRMTRAAAQALAAGGGLRENCVVVITDAPVIGTAGNTSPTEIELNPVSTTAFGQTARVFTTFSPDAWPGVYDIASNSITELRDDWGNVAKDIDANAATVETQFPWHLGSATFRDNYVEDSTLTGWDTQVGSISNNRVIGSTVNLTGKTAGAILDNEFLNVGLVLGAGGASATVIRSKIQGVSSAVTVLNHTGAGSLSFNDVVHRDGFLTVHSGSGTLTVTNSTLQSHINGTVDLNHATTGTASTSIVDSTVNGALNLVAIDNQGAAGSLLVTESELIGSCSLTRAAGTVGPLSVNASKFNNSRVTIGAANAATTNTFSQAFVESGSIFDLRGPIAAPGRNDFTAGARFSGASVTVAATATAGVGVQGGFLNGSIAQNRNAGSGSTSLFHCEIRGFSSVTDNGTTDPGVSPGMNRCRLTDSVVTIGNLGVKSPPGTILQQWDMIGSTLNLSGLAAANFCDKGRQLGSTLTNAGFQAQEFILDGAFTKTLTADNLNKMCSVAFDNVI